MKGGEHGIYLKIEKISSKTTFGLNSSDFNSLPIFFTIVDFRRENFIKPLKRFHFTGA